MAFDTYHQPDNFNIGGQFYGVVSITVGTQYAEIHAAADDDTHESVARHGTGRTSGTVTFVDPHEAEKASGTTGSLTFTWTDAKGSQNLTVTVANCSIGGWDSTVSRDSAASATVSFIAESAPSIANE